MKMNESQDSGEDKDKEMTSEKTGPSRRQFLAQSGRVAAGIGAASLLSNPGQSGLSFAANESLITKVSGTGGAKMKKQDAPQRSKEALAAAVKAELNAPIIKGLEGNLCRCTGYVNIVKSVRRAAELMKA